MTCFFCSIGRGFLVLFIYMLFLCNLDNIFVMFCMYCEMCLQECHGHNGLSTVWWLMWMIQMHSVSRTTSTLWCPIHTTGSSPTALCPDWPATPMATHWNSAPITVIAISAFGLNRRARCSSMVEAPLMVWWVPFELFNVPATAPQLV